MKIQNHRISRVGSLSPTQHHPKFNPMPHTFFFFLPVVTRIILLKISTLRSAYFKKIPFFGAFFRKIHVIADSILMFKKKSDFLKVLFFCSIIYMVFILLFTNLSVDLSLVFAFTYAHINLTYGACSEFVFCYSFNIGIIHKFIFLCEW